ncbi:hypothetical protein AR1Y2_2744 [Anaerostipes rhamnosivorans]|uniref:Uncharacterized protein n=1 Tax=Anaerostipes rhamnosivorans TaxID=1229621 RepID=A0A4P8IEJ4_9FIRM|nr:hypothetical protein AR1Y2_2744 [Anaerostipes rhamnosivorans]
MRGKKLEMKRHLNNYSLSKNKNTEINLSVDFFFCALIYNDHIK